MQFLYPSLLWGLLAVSLPIVIHIFNFRRTRRVFFTNVKFLKAVETETNSFRKIKQWLILASRILFIASLVLAFAQPFLPAKNASKGLRGAVVNSLYLDNSLSMQNTIENKRYLDWAVIKMDELLTLFSQTPTLQLLTNDFDADDQNITNATRIKDRLTTVAFSATPRSLSDVLKRQKTLIHKYNPNAQSQLFWFSDFQKSTVGDLSKIKLDSTDNLFVVPIKGESTQNIYVDSVWLASPFIREMQNNVVFVKLANSGEKGIQKFPIRLMIDETLSSTASVDIPAKGTGTATFNFTVKDRGVHKGKIVFDDQPIVFDNEYYFVLNASPAVRVVHLYQQRSENDYISKVFLNDSLFQFKSYNALNVDIGTIKDANLVVLEGVAQVEGSLKSSLEQFVREGGSLLVIPSAQASEASYRGFLGALGIANISVRTEPLAVQSQLPIAEPQRSNPFYTDVFEQTSVKGVADVPSMQPFWSWPVNGATLLSFRSGQTFLSQTPAQQGKVYVLASPLLKEYGNFAEHAFFVPTMYKMAWLSLKAEAAAYQFSDGSIQLAMPEAPKNATYKLKNGKTELIPIQRMIGNKLYIELPKQAELADNQALESGYYEVQLENKTKKLIALNHTSEESAMEFYTADELRTAFGERSNITVFDNLLDGDFVKSFEQNNIGHSLWKYFIYGALFFLLVEIALIRFLKG